jgi:hypothetical protein
VLIDKQKELTYETFVTLLKAYEQTSSKDYPTLEILYARFRDLWPRDMYKLLKQNEQDWNLYIEDHQGDVEGYIFQTWRNNNLHVPSMQKIYVVINDMKLSYSDKKQIYNKPVVSVW